MDTAEHLRQLMRPGNDSRESFRKAVLVIADWIENDGEKLRSVAAGEGKPFCGWCGFALKSKTGIRRSKNNVVLCQACVGHRQQGQTREQAWEI
jgi:hypothetical protein